ncbi:MAG TPA: hypothetical protein VFA75_07170 [Nevskia sp.]|nr:hypothetical protein [Nevskia sp.]
MAKKRPNNAAIRLYAGLGVDVLEMNTLYHRDSSVGAEPAGSGQRRTARQHDLRRRALAKERPSEKVLAIRRAQAAEIEEGRRQHRAELARKNAARAQRLLAAAARFHGDRAEAWAIVHQLAANNGLPLSSAS